MNHLSPPATVGDEEDLARFIFFKGHIRGDGTIKPDALIPYPYPDLSVHRHHGLGDTDVWVAGQLVGQKRQLPLQGRVDIIASGYRLHKLTVHAAPLPDNPHHAIVMAWPADKAAQKIIAQQIAAKARYQPAASAA